MQTVTGLNLPFGLLRKVPEWFVDAMNRGLDRGREEDRDGWDTYWETCDYVKTLDPLLDKLSVNTQELRGAVAAGSNVFVVLRKAADVANLAMMIPDIIQRMEEKGK